MSSDHLVRPTNADPHLIDLPLFGQPLPNGTAAVSSIPAEPLTILGSTRPDVDWTLVASLRSLASKQLSQAMAAATTRLDKPAQAELGRAIVLDLIESAMAERVDAGDGAWSGVEQTALAQAVFDSLFRLGRLQPLVDDDRVENIIIAGHDNVHLELTDGSLIDGPPVADSDTELIDFLVFLASRSEVNARASPKHNPGSTCDSMEVPAGRRRVGDPETISRDPSSPAHARHARRSRRTRNALGAPCFVPPCRRPGT